MISRPSTFKTLEEAEASNALSSSVVCRPYILKERVHAEQRVKKDSIFLSSFYKECQNRIGFFLIQLVTPQIHLTVDR